MKLRTNGVPPLNVHEKDAPWHALSGSAPTVYSPGSVTTDVPAGTRMCIAAAELRLRFPDVVSSVWHVEGVCPPVSVMTEFGLMLLTAVQPVM